ncbi:MAG: hypothetical protein E6776_05770 [Eggerthella sp.]|nr:hypothetical protein [Eggerthella sp.]
MAYEPDTWSLGDRTFTSRFILGSGKFNLDLVEAAVRDAGAEIVTLAVRRANTGQDGSILDAIPEGVAERVPACVMAPPNPRGTR